MRERERAKERDGERQRKRYGERKRERDKTLSVASNRYKSLVSQCVKRKKERELQRDYKNVEPVETRVAQFFT